MVVALEVKSVVSGAAAECSPALLFGALLALQQRIVLQEALDFLIQLERRQLQQSDRLLQLRRQREVLRELEL